MKMPSYQQTIKFTKVSILTNLFMAFVKIVIGLLNFSFFMFIHGFYNIGISVAKSICINTLSKQPNKEEQYKNYHTIGIVVLITSVIYIFYTFRLFLGYSSSIVYPKSVGIAIAMVTFIEIVLNIKGSISARKSENIILYANKLTNLASSLISLVLTQTAILSFADKQGDPSFANGLSGIIFGCASALIGLYMILHSNGKKKVLTIVHKI